ncbi:SIS domain-containing protein, partial [uncultured Amaricoccus sp.]|uniref:SIS domain-containing protein n=1 Tax=uncultured Amaricoccus sp. TaxID=339341 RepID=UPI00261583FA
MSATRMQAEVAEIPAAARRFLATASDPLAAAAAALRAADPRLLVTVARGSSDHAATYLKYAVEIVAGIPVASVGPSIASIYGRRLRLEGAACLAISQSGRSPDIVEMTQGARAGGALTLALTNAAASPLAAAADHALPLAAGPERSVAATKSFVASVLAGLALLAEWREEAELAAAVAALP